MNVDFIASEILFVQFDKQFDRCSSYEMIGVGTLKRLCVLRRIFRNNKLRSLEIKILFSFTRFLSFANV